MIKLQPSTLDRLSAYGHLAAGDATLGWEDIPIDVGQASWVVHDAGMQISVENLGTGQFVVPLQPIAPEINATGKVVYGYNLRVTAAGTYRIRFASTPAVTFTGVDAGSFDANNAYLDIVVSARRRWRWRRWRWRWRWRPAVRASACWRSALARCAGAERGRAKARPRPSSLCASHSGGERNEIP